MGTGVSLRVWSPEIPLNIKMVAVSVAPLHARRGQKGASPRATEQRIDAAKHLAVSTGQLSALLRVHTRPIDLVIFQEPSHLIGAGGLISRGVSRLDAFSVYPGRTLATQRCR